MVLKSHVETYCYINLFTKYKFEAELEESDLCHCWMLLFLEMLGY